MNKLNKYLVFFALVFLVSFNTSGQGDKIIDESGKTEAIEQIIKIDQVWAGHPVGFCLLTHGNRQYIAYYNAERSMVVGQRSLEEEEFSLHAMPRTSRETSGGTSTVLGWDSHNSVTLGIDKDGFIHLSGNMHVHPITYFKSTKANDISTLEQQMTMVGPNEKRCTYPHFMNTKEGELIFHYRDGGNYETRRALAFGGLELTNIDTFLNFFITMNRYGSISMDSFNFMRA